jgi:hypothetical protein
MGQPLYSKGVVLFFLSGGEEAEDGLLVLLQAAQVEAVGLPKEAEVLEGWENLGEAIAVQAALRLYALEVVEVPQV